MQNENEKLETRTGASGLVDNLVSCNHISTRRRETEEGLWCVDCGEKVYEVETRECKDCKHFFKGPMNYSGCRKHLMAVTPDMNVTFKVEKGTCWRAS